MREERVKRKLNKYSTYQIYRKSLDVQGGAASRNRAEHYWGVPSRGYVRPRWAVSPCPLPTGEEPGPIRSGPSAVLQHPPGSGRGELGGGPEAKLGLDPPAIGFDGVDAQVQLVGDLGRGPPPADQPEHLQLAIREGFVGGAGRPLTAAHGGPQEPLGQRPAQVHLAGQHAPDRLDDLPGGLLLVDIAQGPGAQGPLGVEC